MVASSSVTRLASAAAAVAISAEMENAFECVAHSRQCRELGVNETLLQAVVDRAPVSGGSADEMLAINVARELGRTHKLSDATFAAVRARLGDKGTVDLITAIGYYAMLAVCHVALDIKPGG